MTRRGAPAPRHGQLRRRGAEALRLFRFRAVDSRTRAPVHVQDGRERTPVRWVAEKTYPRNDDGRPEGGRVDQENGAVEKTRTSTGCPTATSTLRVYQFRHNRIFVVGAVVSAGAGSLANPIPGHKGFRRLRFTFPPPLGGHRRAGARKPRKRGRRLGRPPGERASTGRAGAGPKVESISQEPPAVAWNRAPIRFARVVGAHGGRRPNRCVTPARVRPCGRRRGGGRSGRGTALR